MTLRAELLFDSKCILGEGPIWHPARQQLFFFDIIEQALFAVTPDGELADEWMFNETATAAALLDDDTLVLATDTGLKSFDLKSGGMNRVCEIEADREDTRSNDARVHPSGAFWVGTMHKSDDEKPAGAIYHYRHGQLTTIKSGLRIPNAICFSPDGRTAYHTDTPTEAILRCDVDTETGLPTSDWGLFADTTDLPGHPDGAVVDSEGFLWSARWGGSCVIRFAPNGSVERTVEVPASQVTCPAFGGEDRKTLFITTARQGLTDQQKADEPAAGGLFSVTVDVAGQAEPVIEL
jgi:sugar lactone lactonase YvrE